MSDAPIQIDPKTSVSLGTPTNYGRIADSIRQSIGSGEFPQGMRLKVQDLSRRFGISTNPIREALQQLLGEGLITLEPNKGAVVRVLSRDLIANVFDIREALDGLLTRRAAQCATPDQVDELVGIDRSLKEARDSGSDADAKFYSARFHEYIGEIAGNPEALKVRRANVNLFASIRRQYSHSPDRIPQIEAEHLAIIEAIRAGDADGAEAAARLHARNSRVLTLAMLDPDESGHSAAAT